MQYFSVLAILSPGRLLKQICIAQHQESIGWPCQSALHFFLLWVCPNLSCLHQQWCTAATAYFKCNEEALQQCCWDSNTGWDNLSHDMNFLWEIVCAISDSVKGSWLACMHAMAQEKGLPPWVLLSIIHF